MSNFWKNLPAGFLGLSPMDGVTDHPFRHLQKKYGNPAVMYTEFTCVEGITHGATRLLNDFLYDETQRPIVAQIYGHTPDDFRTVAALVCALGFDGVDINMGCPAKNVTHTGSGAALIKTPELAQQIIQSVKDGVNDWVNGKNVEDLPLSDEIKKELESRIVQSKERTRIPVSVKTRIGYSQPIVEEWIPTLLEMEPAVIAIHGRTLNQHYAGQANWDEIGKAKLISQESSTLIIGNGDVKTYIDYREKVQTYGVDGVLIGRATMGNPWIFKDREGTQEERFALAIEHARLFEKTFSQSEKYNFLPMRKHLGWYVKEFPGASLLRQQLVRANSSKEVEQILKNFEMETQHHGRTNEKTSYQLA